MILRPDPLLKSPKGRLSRLLRTQAKIGGASRGEAHQGTGSCLDTNAPRGGWPDAAREGLTQGNRLDLSLRLVVLSEKSPGIARFFLWR